MHSPAEPDLPLIRRRDRPGEPFDYRRVRRALASGKVTRVAPGTFLDRDRWLSTSPVEKHRLRVIEAAERMRKPAVFALFAAAAWWNMEILGPWPTLIDVRVPRDYPGRSTGLIRRHAWGTDGIELVEWGRHAVTSPAQTAIDLASVLDRLHGVVVLDQALWRRREGGPLTTWDELEAIHVARETPRGAARVRNAVADASELSDSVRESQSRVLLKRLGFPEPLLQHPIPLTDGAFAFPDFYFPDRDHSGEFDGLGKYLDPALLEGRTPEEALIAEKDREDALRRVVSRVSRWRTPALRRPRELYDILVADGLPSSKYPPPSGLVLPD
ncbi:hypothetical protein [Microbacterium sp. NPDC058345]|uniref:hypothetical protein n=1 Tax=Microbacterium sp. NPDC058345 TaxID=3346455 RepID=UPI003654D203